MPAERRHRDGHDHAGGRERRRARRRRASRPGEFDELVSALRAGATYVNVHTDGRPGGEIRGQIGGKEHRDGDDHDGH